MIQYCPLYNIKAEKQILDPSIGHVMITKVYVTLLVSTSKPSSIPKSIDNTVIQDNIMRVSSRV